MSMRARLSGPDGANIPSLCLLTSYHLAGWAMVVGGAPSMVSDILGAITHVAWIVMLLAGPAVSVVGLGLADQWAGTLLRIAGGLAVAGALAVFLVALIRSAGLLVFTTWVVAGLVAANAWLLARDVRLWWAIESAARSEPGGAGR